MRQMKNMFGVSLPQQCETSYDCERPDVCCDLLFGSFCCSGGLMIPEVTREKALQRQAIPIPVEVDKDLPFEDFDEDTYADQPSEDSMDDWNARADSEVRAKLAGKSMFGRKKKAGRTRCGGLPFYWNRKTRKAMCGKSRCDAGGSRRRAESPRARAPRARPVCRPREGTRISGISPWARSTASAARARSMTRSSKGRSWRGATGPSTPPSARPSRSLASSTK